MNIYRLNEFAKLIGKSIQTLQRWDRQSILKAHRSITNRRYYTHEQYLEYTGRKTTAERKNIVYYRVSSSAQKQDLLNQKIALEQFCAAKGIEVSDWLYDIGSGLNYKRKNFVLLNEMVERLEVKNIIIAHKDRFVRFGFDWFESFCENHGVTITIMNQESLSPETEMTRDLLSIIHCFSSRLYGLRKYKKKIHDLIDEKNDKELLPNSYSKQN